MNDPLTIVRLVALSCVLVGAQSLIAQTSRGNNVYLGGGAKAGEITDQTAIVHVRLTATPGQDKDGLIPGREGEARLQYATDESLREFTTTPWETAVATEDHSIQFHLTGLSPAERYFYRVEMRTSEDADTTLSDPHSFVTAPAPDQLAPVFFHLTTCQDTRGESTYVPMAAQRPDFCVSAGDTVYYDGEGLARTVPQA